MAKYMIQDIIPPERKHPHSKGTVKGSATKKSETAEKVMSHEHKEESATPLHRETTVSHVFHHEQHQEDEPVHEIHEEIAERPQSMIIENLYGDHSSSEAKPTALPRESNIDGGVYPYNKPAPEKSFAQKPAWKFPETPSWRGKLGGWVPWVLIPILIIAGGVMLLNYFAGATVLLIPKHDTPPIPAGETFTALKTPTDGELGFSVMKVTLDDSREVNATGTKTVTAKASGKIVIYNEQTAAQRLIKNTRFESAKGLIYRINDSINVPKATVKSGKTTPGSIEVSVYADEAGPTYNSPATDFTVPGLKNTPQAKKVYARSNGPIAGGASGTIKSVSDQELKQASDDIRVSLETKLRAKARGDLAATQITYDQNIFISLEDPKLSNQQASSEDKAVLTETGTLYMIVFDRGLLSKAIARTLIPTYSGENIEIKNLDSLTLTAPNVKTEDLETAEKFEFTLSGTPSLVWQVDEQKIRKDLVGVKKTNFNLILSQYSNIERAKASIQPIWKSTFPTEENDITVKLVDEIPN